MDSASLKRMGRTSPFALAEHPYHDTEKKTYKEALEEKRDYIITEQRRNGFVFKVNRGRPCS